LRFCRVDRAFRILPDFAVSDTAGFTTGDKSPLQTTRTAATPVSLGAERLFRLKRRDGTVVFSERLPHGSLLIMAGDTHKNFKHEVPKEPGVTQPRINLTFRRIEHK
jgi:2OG-Fe(II) oxygenase superfamily